MGIVELHYYESVLETTVRITAQVVDSSLRKASTQGKTGYEGSTENDESAEAPETTLLQSLVERRLLYRSVTIKVGMLH